MSSKRKKMVVALISLLAAASLFVWFVIPTLERRFRQIHPDESEAKLLEIVGAPTSIRGCGEGVYKLPTDGDAGMRRCERVYWYSVYIFTDGWLVPIDDTGHIIQIRRLALP